LLLIKNLALLLLFLLASYIKVVFNNVGKRSDLPCPRHCMDI